VGQKTRENLQPDGKVFPRRSGDFFRIFNRFFVPVTCSGTGFCTFNTGRQKEVREGILSLKKFSFSFPSSFVCSSSKAADKVCVFPLIYRQREISASGSYRPHERVDVSGEFQLWLHLTQLKLEPPNRHHCPRPGARQRCCGWCYETIQILV